MWVDIMQAKLVMTFIMAVWASGLSAIKTCIFGKGQDELMSWLRCGKPPFCASVLTACVLFNCCV